MSIRNQIFNFLLAGTSFLAIAPGAALAETAEAAGEGGQISDIVVTAERRDVNLQSAPLAVSAIDADTLRADNITDITGLNGTVPGLVVARSGGAERIISIRGIGSETPENTNTQPGVSYHVDGVYIFNTIAANAAFIDVAQVEVLRGPQGTMFGQGSTGGTINVVSAQPSLDGVSGAINFGAGNHAFFKGDAAINVPLGDTLAIRGAVQGLKHDGYAKAYGVNGYPDGYELDDAKEWGGKLSLLWQPIDDFSITLTTIQYDGDVNGPAQKNILDPEPDPRKLTQDYPARSKVRTELYYGVVKLDLPDFATLKTITSYQKLHSEQSWDADALTADLFCDLTYIAAFDSCTRYDHVAIWRSDTKSWTQEINLASNTEGRFGWIAGGVYLRSRNEQYINEFRGGDDNIVQPPLPVDTPYDDPLVDTLTYAELSAITREAWAAYFQGSYKLTDRLSLIAGIRYNRDKYSGQFASVGDATSGGYLQPAPIAGFSTEEVTGKAAVQFEITPRNMVYASYTRGFKPGGLNGSASAGNSYSINPTYLPETVDAFEIGSKNRLFGNSVQLNLAAFLYNYHNMQFLEEDPILFGEGTSNAPRARIYGLEAEASWIVTPGLKLDASLSLLDGEFTADYFALDPAVADAAQTAAGYPGIGLFFANFFPALLARDAARANINGNEVPKLPGVQGFVSATFNHEVGPGMLTARAKFVYRGEYQYRLFNLGAIDTVPSYETVDISLQYQPNGINLTLGLSVENLFDTVGLNSRLSDPYGSAQVTDTYIPPRQFIASVGYKF